jgi:hypothetical protein
VRHRTQGAQLPIVEWLRAWKSEEIDDDAENVHHTIQALSIVALRSTDNPDSEASSPPSEIAESAWVLAALQQHRLG